MPYDPGFDITQNFGGNGGGGAPNGAPKEGPPGGVGGQGGPGIQLPQDISNMLASIQQQSMATGGQSLQANSVVRCSLYYFID